MRLVAAAIENKKKKEEKKKIPLERRKYDSTRAGVAYSNILQPSVSSPFETSMSSMSSSFSPGNDLYNPLYLSHCQHTGYERENDIYLDVWKFTRDEIVVGGLFLKISWRKCLYFIRAVARINESAGKPFVPNCCDTILESES